MKNIITVALGTIFPKENIESIMEVIGATPNPEVATQILLGIYEEPEVQESAVLDGKNCFPTRYDKWTNKVHYSYEVNDSKHIYIKQGTDTSLITEENYTEFAVPYNSEVSVGYKVNLSKMITINSEVYLETWNGKPLVK